MSASWGAPPRRTWENRRAEVRSAARGQYNGQPTVKVSLVAAHTAPPIRRDMHCNHLGRLALLLPNLLCAGLDEASPNVVPDVGRMGMARTSSALGT